MLTAIIAVLGTLLGSLVSGWIQRRATQSQRSADLLETRRSEQLDTITTLSVAVSDHRRAMWEVTDATLTGQPEERITELRDESHRTRSAITSPAVRVRLLIRDSYVRTAAAEAVQSTYDMRNARDLDDLQSMRALALNTHDLMVNVAAKHLETV